MKIGKDIDRIYRDRLKGAQLPPPPDAWENILSHLDKEEKKRRFVPLWIKLSGVAAVLALFFTVFPWSSTPPAAEIFKVSSISEKTDFSIPEVSADFNKIMKESEALLQALIMKSSKTELQEKKGEHAPLPVDENIAGSRQSFEGSRSISQAGTNNINEIEMELAEESSKDRVPADELVETSLVLQKEDPVNSSLQKGNSEGKFRLSTRIAPVYLNNFGKGNLVDRSFSNKDAAGEVTLSYGLNVAYEISEKLNIRSGFHKVDLAYNTRKVSFNDVAATTSFDHNVLENSFLSSPSPGTLNQKMGFFEVPLEVEYMLLDKKFAIGLIGGGSALFLEENQVSLSLLGNSTDLGESNSMNKLSFTTNFGLSLGYDVSRQLQINMEPVIKLQLNTFKNSENSSPYFFGIYSGFSYKF